ncbi:hypothetical protein [Streptomyces plumbiresistens]|uniref:Integral membrane protein n=1 Tax=Streptomyces plumbiresistens TaxID=511811 RepID=A0ABP7Q050_9ACTN
MTLVGVIIVEGEHFRWAEVTLLLVVTAAIALIMSIQIGADARKYLYNLDTIKAWYPDDQAKFTRAWSERSTHFNTWKTRIRRAVVAFNTGTMLLILAVSSALLPRDNDAFVRWIAAGLALASAVVEAWWVRHLFHEAFDEAEEKPRSLDGGRN